MKVVVTGVGLISPFGASLDAAISGLEEGRVCAREGDVAGVRAMVASVPQLSLALEVMRADLRPAEAFLQGAVEQALANARPPSEFFYGTCSGEMQRFEQWMVDSRQSDGRFYEAPATNVARLCGLPVPLVFTSACTSALTALAAAFAAVASGEAETALAAGSDATCAFATSGFLTLKAASTRVCQPFSRTRSGLNFGEGAAAVLLESERSALNRGAKILARVHGVGLSGDAKHVTAPRQDGVGLEYAIRAALGDWSLESVDAYVAHGTGTNANDSMEIALGTRLGLIGKPWLAHKAFIGHAMGASGLMSFILANEQMRRGMAVRMPYDDLEPQVQLNVSLRGCKRAVASAAAFGGANAAVAWEAA